MKTKEEINLFLAQANALLEEQDLIAALANLSALVMDFYRDRCSWAGFYLLKEGELVLGPFQGKVACTYIQLGKGVCGTAAITGKTQCVKNVHEFPGHIACDAGSNSEIVVNIMKNSQSVGVLDLDSYEFSAFSEEDAVILEKLTALISNRF